MSISGTNATSSNSSESYCSSPPLTLPQVHDQTQQQLGYYTADPYNNTSQQQQYQHPQAYYPQQPLPPHAPAFYPNTPQTTGWTGQGPPPPPNHIQSQPQPQHYYPYSYTPQQQYPQQHQQHALVDLSRFVQQSSGGGGPPVPIRSPPLSMPNSPRPVHPAKSSQDSSTTPTPSGSGSSNQMIPARFQNMTKGARTKARMRKLKQEQVGTTEQGQKSLRKSPKKSPEEVMAKRTERNSYDEAIEAALLLIESSHGEEHESEASINPEEGKKVKRRKRKSKTSDAKTKKVREKVANPRPRKKLSGSPNVSQGITSPIVDSKRQGKVKGGTNKMGTAVAKAKSKVIRASLPSMDSLDQNSEALTVTKPVVLKIEKNSTENMASEIETPPVPASSTPRRGRPPKGTVRSEPATKRKRKPVVRRPKSLGEPNQPNIENLNLGLPEFDSQNSSKKKGNKKIGSTSPHIDPANVKPPEELPSKPRQMKIPTVKTKKPSMRLPQNIQENREKLRAPSIKVKRGAVKFYRGSDEVDPDEPLRKVNMRDRILGEYDENVPWECRFCGLGPLDMKLGDLFGPYYVNTIADGIPGKKETWLHQDCALWAGGVILVATTLRGLDSAVHHADKLDCTICKKKGATIGCLAKGCTTSVHFPCGKLNEWSLDYQTFHSYCQQHKGVSSSYSGRY